MSDRLKLEMGDVFFANTTFEFAYANIYGDKKYKKGVDALEVSDGGERRERRMVTKGFDPKTGARIQEETHEHEHFDKHRVGKSYVVEEVRVDQNEDRGSRWTSNTVFARRLNSDGSYNPKGELITFVDDQHGYTTSAIVKPYKRMKREINFV